MAIAGTPLWLTSSAGIGANQWAIKDAGGSTNTSTKANFGTSTSTGYILASPGVTNSTRATPDITADGPGWNVVAADMDPATGDRRVLPAGTYVFHTTIAPSVSDALTTAYAVRVYMFRRTAAGAYQYLSATGESPGGGLALGNSFHDVSVPLGSDEYFGVGESLHVEVWIKGKGVALTGQTVTFQIGTVADRDGEIDLPEQGLRTEFRRTALADTAVASDAVTRLVAFPRVSSDIAVAADSLMRVLNNVRGTGDTARASDAVARVLLFPRITADTAPAADVATRAVIVGRAVSDVARASDSVTRALFGARATLDAARAEDATARALIQARGTTDIALAVDGVGRQVWFTKATSDTARALDAATRAVVSSRALTDTTRASDALARVYTANRLLQDYARAADVLTRIMIANRTIPDAAPVGADIVERLVLFFRTTIDTALADDSVWRDLNYGRTLREYIGGPADFPVDFPEKFVAGIVRNSSGVPVAGATVKLFRQTDDLKVAEQVSGEAGEYSFVRDRYDPNPYYVIAYLPDATPQVHGVSDRGLLPV